MVCDLQSVVVSASEARRRLKDDQETSDQCPHATQVAGYNTWRDEFDRYVKEGEQAIWIWAPIITKQCPECENSPSYHEQSDCEYDETPPGESGLRKV